MKEFRYAFRQLLRQPGFTVLAVVALALGIGANTVLFSAINTLFLRPLSYPHPEQLNGVRVTENFFRALGVQPLFGRVFTPEEDKAGGANVAVLTHTFWQKRFGGDQNILGQSVTLNGAPFTIVGVLPPTLKFPFIQTQVFLPRVFEQEGLPPEIIERGTGFLTM